MKTVFITGANGFIGKALMARFSDMGWGTVGIDLHADAPRNVHAANLMEPSAWQEHMVGCCLVIHTAAVVSNTADWDETWEINVRGTKLLIDVATDAGVDRFLHLSSVAAFGFTFEWCIGEDAPLKPMNNVYVDSKIASEHTVLKAHASGRIKTTIVRPCDVYGPGSRPWVVIPLETLKGGLFVLPAKGLGRFSPVYIDNLIDGLVLAATKAEGAGQVFTIGDGVDLSSKDFFAYHERFANKKGSVKSLPSWLANLLAALVQYSSRLTSQRSEIGRGTMDMLSRRGSYDISKAQRLLGYQPAVDLEQGMKLTEQWLVDNKLVG